MFRAVRSFKSKICVPAYGCASVARGLSNYLDQLVDNVMQESFTSVLHLHVDFLSPYIDFFAFSISFLLSVVLAFGVKESMSLNNLFTAVNMAVVLFVIVAGAFNARIANWQIDKADLPPNVHGGDGGFFPFGVMGVLRGAATCFYGFIGFDCVATTGEEVKNPQRAIPIAIIVSLIIIFLSYFGVSAVLTLMWPYYLQDADAPLPYVFHEIGWPLAQWTVAIGGIFGLFASLFGAMYPLPRVIYAMANDGLIFKFLGEVHPKYKTPLVGTLLAGVITGLMAALFKLQQLVNMLSIGTLVAYTIVAACVILLRYRCLVNKHADVQDEEEAVSLLSDSEKLADDIYRCHGSDDSVVSEYKETTNLVSLKEKPTFLRLIAQVFNSQCLRSPTAVTSRLVSILVLIFCGLSIALGLCLVNMEYDLMYGRWGPLTLVCVISSLLLLVVLSIALQPSSSRELAFKVPLVPFIPAFSILLNIYLILMLDLNTWIRFLIWMAVGVGVYFIAFACRTVKWCGRPPARTSVSSSAVATEIIPVTDGVGVENYSPVSMNGASKISQYEVEPITLISEENSVQDQTRVDLKIESASPTPSDSLGGDMKYLPMRDREQAVGKESNCSVKDCGETEPSLIREEESPNALINCDSCRIGSMSSIATSKISVEQTLCNGDDWAHSNSSYFDDDDDNDYTSITEVANDLLSLTYQNELLIGTGGPLEKPLVLLANQEHSRCSLPTQALPALKETLVEEIFMDTETGRGHEVGDENNVKKIHKNQSKFEADHIMIDVGDYDAEDDVRSLYPDVVVISSSEDDTCSRSSVSSRSTCAEIGLTATVPINDNICVDTTELLRSNPVRLREDKEKEKCPEEIVQFSVTKILTFASLEYPGSDSSEISENSPDAEVSTGSPFKNASFVEKLEKIIGAQSLKVKPIHNSVSLVPISSSSGLDGDRSTDLLEVEKGPIPLLSSLNDLSDSPSASEPLSFQISDQTTDDNGTWLPKQEVDTPDIRTNDSNEGPSHGTVGDIRSKLERIFSSGIGSGVVSPVLKANPTLWPESPDKTSVTPYNTFAVKELNESNLEHSETVNEILVSKEIDETRKRMDDVLGTLRLKNLKQPDPESL